MQGGLKRAITAGAVCGYPLGDAFTLSDAMLASIGTGAPQTGDSCPRFSPPEGSLIRGSGPAVYVAQGGTLRHLPNLATLQARGHRWGDVNGLPDSYIAPIGRGKPVLNIMTTGFLIKGAAGAAAYVMDGGAKRHITSLDTLNGCGYNWGAIYVLPDDSVNSIPTGPQLSGGPCPTFSPPDGSLIVGSAPEVYYTNAGLKRHVPNVETLNAFRLSFANLDWVPSYYVNALNTGHPLLNIFGQGVLLKSSAPEVYVMDGGARRHITSLEAFNACGYQWGGIQQIAHGDLQVPGLGPAMTGPPCPAYSLLHGTLVKGAGPELYVIDRGTRRHITDPLVFDVCGYHWGNMNQVPDGLLATVPIGAPVSGSSCP